MKVLITDKINEKAAQIISEVAQVDIFETMSEDKLSEVIKDYDALMVRSQTKVTKKIIESGKNLKIIGRAGVGVDNIDIDSATQNGIIVVNSPDGNTNAAAEHTIGMMLAMSRNIALANESIKKGLWERSKFVGNEVFGKTIGIIGLGKIGSQVAKVCNALGMKVVVFDPYTPREVVEKMGCSYIEHFYEFLPLCDYITIHTPKTKETLALINRNSLNRMKKGVRIINCARGGIIDEFALKDALESGQVGGCAIDVFENEKEISSSPIINLDLPNILLTPHLGASTQEAQINVALDVANQIKEVLTGGQAHAAVNIPALRIDKLEPVKNYMTLSQQIAQVASQLSGDKAINKVEITVFGELTQLDITPLEVAILKGLLSNKFESVNYVNAPILAKQKGINVLSRKSNSSCSYLGEIKIKLFLENDIVIVSGALIAEHIPRIVQLNHFKTSIVPENHMLIIPHENKPGMIAKVATAIGNVNINSMQVEQQTDSNDSNSIMIINIDEKVDENTLLNICQIQGINDAKYIHIN